MKKSELKKRIRRERSEMGLKPWQLSPSQVNDGPNPYSPSCAGWAAWEEAQRWREEIKAKNPDYFDGGDDGHH